MRLVVRGVPPGSRGSARPLGLAPRAGEGPAHATHAGSCCAGPRAPPWPGARSAARVRPRPRRSRPRCWRSPSSPLPVPFPSPSSPLPVPFQTERAGPLEHHGADPGPGVRRADLHRPRTHRRRPGGRSRFPGARGAALHTWPPACEVLESRPFPAVGRIAIDRARRGRGAGPVPSPVPPPVPAPPRAGAAAGAAGPLRRSRPWIPARLSGGAAGRWPLKPRGAGERRPRGRAARESQA